MKKYSLYPDVYLYTTTGRMMKSVKNLTTVETDRVSGKTIFTKYLY